jgi:hypothetical protein
MLHAVSGEDAEGPVVELNRDGHGEGTFRKAKPVPDRLVDVGVLEGLVEVPDGLEEERIFELGRQLAARSGRGLRLGHALESIQALPGG